MKAVSWRLMPFLVLLYLVAYIDRSNVGFAKLTLQQELALSSTAFTLGQVAFFVAYAVFEIPSNILLERFGARRWFTRIILSWGLVTVATALIRTPSEFYLARFLLGAAEAGFYPGVLYYITKWYPYRHRARVIGLFMLAQPLAFIIGNPYMGVVNGLHGTFGLDGWQWIFVATGAPAVLLAFVTLRFLPDGPAAARWLNEEQRAWIAQELKVDAGMASNVHGNPLRALRDRRVVAMAIYYFCFPFGCYGLGFWLPTIVNGFGGLSSLAIGFITAIPYVFVALGLYVIPKLVDLGGSRYAWIAGIAALGALGLVGSALAVDHLLQLAFISVAAVGLFGCQPMIWSLPSRFLTGAQAAAAIAMINAVGNLGGGFGPMGIAVVVDRTGSVATGLYVLAAVVAIAVVATFAIQRVIEKPRSDVRHFA